MVFSDLLKSDFSSKRILWLWPFQEILSCTEPDTKL